MRELWYICRRQQNAQRHLYCFPHAGGGVETYLSWQKMLAPAIEVRVVQLPGRGGRFGEPLPTSIEQAVSQLLSSFDNELSRAIPYSFFGHSLGALIAYETALALTMADKRLPKHLIVSGCDAPHHLVSRKNYHEMSDTEMVAALKEFNATSDEAMDNQEMREFLLPIVRSDFVLGDRYEHHHSAKLTIPCTVLSGTQDDHVDTTAITRWEERTTGKYEIHWFDGGHFYFQQNQDQVMSIIQELS